MSYLRRLVAKMQATTPRLVPRRSPSFGGAPGLEERDEDVVVSARTLDAPQSEPRAAASAPAVSPDRRDERGARAETRSDRGLGRRRDRAGRRRRAGRAGAAELAAAPPRTAHARGRRAARARAPGGDARNGDAPAP